jgi:hypothetical protein
MMENAAFLIFSSVDEARRCETPEAWQEKRSCMALWAAVLIRAYDDYWGKLTNWGEYNRERRVVDEARRWFTSDRKGVSSFLWVCEVLGLDPEAIRKRIAQGARKDFLEDEVGESN